MDRSRSSNPLILLLTLSVVAATIVPRVSPQDGRGEPEDRSPPVVPAQFTDYRGPLEHFLDKHFDNLPYCGENLDPDHLAVHTLIATLPDPSNPRLADSFDSYLASIQSALAQAGYLADQFWLPWIDEKQKKDRTKNRMLFADGDRVTVEDGVFGTKAMYTLATQGPDPKSIPLKEQPGVILFRSHPDPAVRQDKLLVLLVVGETPTSGIRPRKALWHALDYANALSCALPKNELKKFRIIGPSFSGSAYSLSESIRDWLKRHPGSEFRILTGSATNFATKAILERSRTGAEKRTQVEFSATVAPDSALAAFYDYVASSFGDNGLAYIARLTESNTSYGQGSETPKPAQTQKSPHQGEETLDTQLSRFFRWVHPVPKPMIFDLPFPLHVAQLGAEYQKARAQSGTDSAPSGGGMPLVLGLNLAEQAEPSDVVPALSSMTKSSSDLSLSNSLAVLSRAHMNLVGIVATDPRDEVFLAQAVHRAAPDTQVFLTEADLLFTHPSLADELRGAIVVSRYPLQILNQLWSPPRGELLGRRLQFATGSAEGVYNAAILMMKDFDQTQFPIEYGMPFERTSGIPPLWVGIVGHEAILPVRVLSPAGNPSASGDSNAARGWRNAQDYVEHVERTDEAPRVVIPPGILHSSATFLLFLVLASLVTAAFPAPWPGKKDGRRFRARVADFLFPAPDAFAGKRRLLLAAPPPAVATCKDLWKPYASVQLLAWQSLVGVYVAALVPLVAPLLAEQRLIAAGKAVAYQPTSLHLVELRFSIFSVIALLVFVIVLHIRLHRLPADARPSIPRPLAWHAAPLCWVGGGVVLALSMVYAFQVLVADVPAHEIFLWVRTSNWLSGVSPALPLVCFGFAVVATAWTHLRRLEIAAVERGDLKLSKLFPCYAAALEKVEERASEISEGRYLVPAGLLVAIAAATAAVLHFSWIRATVEADSWRLLMAFLFASLVAGVVHGTILVAQVWRSTRFALDELAGHPITNTYVRLREPLTGMVGMHTYAAALRPGPLEARIRACGARLSRCTGTGGELVAQTTEAAAALDANGWDVPNDTLRAAFDLRSELVALQAVRILLRRVSAIRALIGALTIDALVLLLSTRIYPFQPQSILSALSWALLLGVVAVCVWILLEMERNAMLSYMSGSEPGKITWDFGFMSQLIVYAGLPILALVAAHFPEVGKPLFDWIRPLAGSVK